MANRLAGHESRFTLSVPIANGERGEDVDGGILVPPAVASRERWEDGVFAGGGDRVGR